MKLRILNLPRLKAQLQWEPRDLWIGLFWRVNREMAPPFYTLHIYLCLVPLIPLHVTILRRTRQSESTTLQPELKVKAKHRQDCQRQDHDDVL